jgi:hypothetical protein
MSIFWVPDEDDLPRGGLAPPGTVADEVARWIDERALHRAEAALRGFALRLVTTARDLPRRRLARRLEPSSLRHRRAS